MFNFFSLQLFNQLPLINFARKMMKIRFSSKLRRRQSWFNSGCIRIQKHQRNNGAQLSNGLSAKSVSYQMACALSFLNESYYFIQKKTYCVIFQSFQFSNNDGVKILFSKFDLQKKREKMKTKNDVNIIFPNENLQCPLGITPFA